MLSSSFIPAKLDGFQLKDKKQVSEKEYDKIREEIYQLEVKAIEL